MWMRCKDMLSWLSCHTAGFERLGGVLSVPATVRVNNEKTAVGARRRCLGHAQPDTF